MSQPHLWNNLTFVKWPNSLQGGRPSWSVRCCSIIGEISPRPSDIRASSVHIYRTYLVQRPINPAPPCDESSPAPAAAPSSFDVFVLCEANTKNGMQFSLVQLSPVKILESRIIRVNWVH